MARRPRRIPFETPKPAEGEAGASAGIDGKGGQLDTTVGGAEGLPAPGKVALLEGPTSDAQLESARQMARENPAAVATILRQWVSSEAA